MIDYKVVYLLSGNAGSGQLSDFVYFCLLCHMVKSYYICKIKPKTNIDGIYIMQLPIIYQILDW